MFQQKFVNEETIKNVVFSVFAIAFSGIFEKGQGAGRKYYDYPVLSISLLWGLEYNIFL